MTKIFFAILLFLSVASFGASRAHAADAPDATQRRLLDEVRLFTKANANAIRSIRYSYTMNQNALRWRSVVRRSGERYYQASIIESVDGGLSLPAEIAWDGQRSFDRTRFQMLSITNAEGVKSVVTRPDAELFDFLSTAFGDTPPSERQGASYRLRSASLDRGTNEIRLEFEGSGTGMTLTSFHDRSRNCMPVRVEITYSDGRPMCRLQRVEYAEFKTPGGNIYFPQEIESGVYNFVAASPKDADKLPPELKYVFHVHDIEMNPPLSKDEFQLVPYPFDDVLDGNTGAMRPAADPDWMQIDQIGFPFRDFAISLQASGNLPTAASRGLAPVTEGQAKAADPAQPVDRVTYVSWSLGVFCAAVLGVLLLRHYRKG